MDTNTLVTMIRPVVKGIARNKNTPETAEDLESDLMLHLLTQFPKFSHLPDLDVLKMSKTVLKNRMFDILRFQKRRPQHFNGYLFSFSDSNPNSDEYKESGLNIPPDRKFMDTIDDSLFTKNLVAWAKQQDYYTREFVLAVVEPPKSLLKYWEKTKKRTSGEPTQALIREWLGMTKENFQHTVQLISQFTRYNTVEV